MSLHGLLYGWYPAKFLSTQQKPILYDVPPKNARSNHVIIQKRDGSLVSDTRWSVRRDDQEQRYFAQIPVALLEEQDSLIERLISFAFDTLGVRYLDMRVRETE